MLLLASKAFPTLQDEAREELALSRYLDQLSDPQVSFGVKQRRPKTIHEAVSSTIELQSYLLTKSSNCNVRQVTEKEPEEEAAVAMIQSTQKGLMEMMQKLVGRVEQLELTSQKSRQPAPRRSQANRQMGAVVCYRCGQQGHLARGCTQPRQATPQGTTKTNYPVEQNAPPTFSINNVSSYLLSCRIYDSPVSFLIDTGAGVSLLSKLTWDKIKPTEEGLNPIVTHRLVGVDGVPIKVDGTVSVPITIGKVTLQHDFIVAEQITAEAILGLDFLEANKCILDLASGKMQITDQTVSLISQPSIKKVQCTQVRVTENLTIPPRSEMEIMARIHSKEEGTWLLEGTPFKELPIYVARALMAPRKQNVPIRIVNVDPLPVTIHRNTKIATAELITEEVICSTSEREQAPTYTELEVLLHPLPHDITESQKEQFLALLSHYSCVIAKNPDDLGCTQMIQHHIDTNGASPIRQQARRVPLPRRETVKTLLQGMLDKGIITPSRSPWASPIVLVTKKDGSTRFCVDYRKVNTVTRKDAYPLPRVDDTLDTLSGSTWFSTIDLKSGYWQVEMTPNDREKTAFCTQEGLFEFNVMPFGLCNASATFQRLMDCVLAGLQWSSCLVYIDDIIIVGRSFEEHLHHLQQVLDRLKSAGLKIQPSKCHFLQKKVNFLGHIVSSEGVSPDPSKTSRVKEWPTPHSVLEVQQFLGLANYYRRFVKNFATIAKPLHQATEKNKQFTWTAQCAQAFNQLKDCLTSTPILAMPDWSKPFILDTDACDTGIGAVLSQSYPDGSERVTAYASRLLIKPERNYCVTRKELLAVVAFINHFRHYLIGKPFIIRMDHFIRDHVKRTAVYLCGGGFLIYFSVITDTCTHPYNNKIPRAYTCILRALIQTGCQQ